MKKILILSSLFLVIAIHSIAQDAAQQVKDCFEKYKKALLAGDAVTAVSLVDTHTIQYYQDVLEKAKTSDSAQVEQLPLMDKMMVLLLRYRLSGQQITSMDGKSLLTYSIKEGMIGKASVANASMGAVTINENTAKGKMIARGAETSMYFSFNKEAGQWKVDLTSLFPVATDMMKLAITQTGKNENDFLLFIIGMGGENSSGKGPGSWLWQPVK